MAAFTQGAISERLAESIIGTLAFTTEVPYREDVGHDFHCVLYVPSSDGKMLNAGPSFNVQVKSNRRALSYKKLHAREWLATQQTPFFVCTVDRERLTCDIYSTWNLHNGVLRYGYGAPDDSGSFVKVIKLVLPPSRSRWTGFPEIDDPSRKGGVLSIPLGPPILRLKPDSVKDPEDHPCEWWMGGGRARQTVRALERFHNAVIDRELGHTGSYVLTRHALNARRRISKAGIQIAKEHPDSPRKIDALVASVLAFEARAEAIAAGISEQREMGGFTF